MKPGTRFLCIYDPSDSYPRGHYLARGQFCASLEDGHLPPCSIWEVGWISGDADRKDKPKYRELRARNYFVILEPVGDNLVMTRLPQFANGRTRLAEMADFARHMAREHGIDPSPRPTSTRKYGYR